MPSQIPSCHAVRRVLFGTLLAAIVVFEHPARSETTTAVSAPAAAAPSPPADYHPSMGDLMTMAVQPRHTKLALAGRRRNWAYAAYELNELRNAFARVGRTIPVYRTADTAAVLDAMTRVPLAAVERAIHDKDSRAFDSAYAELTAACNACHVSQEHAMVVIRVPSEDAYPDQEFAPPRER
jgi:hypothetical protein